MQEGGRKAERTAKKGGGRLKRSPEQRSHATCSSNNDRTERTKAVELGFPTHTTRNARSSAEAPKGIRVHAPIILFP